MAIRRHGGALRLPESCWWLALGPSEADFACLFPSKGGAVKCGALLLLQHDQEGSIGDQPDLRTRAGHQIHWLALNNSTGVQVPRRRINLAAVHCTGMPAASVV